jgi:hypothetical protein
MVLFRTQFDAGNHQHATLRCAADSKYRLWVNGAHIGTGPARGHAEHPYADTYRIALTPGANTIAFRVQHYTDKKSPIFDAVRGGLICQIEAGRDVLAASDATWRAMTSEAFAPIEGRLYTQCYDANREPGDWEQCDFNDRDWPAARAIARSPLAPPEALRPRPAPNVGGPARRPAAIINAGRRAGVSHGATLADTDIATSLWNEQEDYQPLTRHHLSASWPANWSDKPLRMRPASGESMFLAFDMGDETLASLEFVMEGPAGTLVDYGVSECLDNNKVATRWQGMRLSERLILRDGRTHFRAHQPRGFRFLIVRVTPPPGQDTPIVLHDLVAHEEI